MGRKQPKKLKTERNRRVWINDQFIRLMAEFDNFRKRTEKEKSGMYAMGAKDVLEKILPVLDNFERGFALVSEEDQEDPFTQGMEKIYKQFVTVLTDLGVTPIDATGKVAEELLKGYMYKDTVLRHSMVKVAN